MRKSYKQKAQPASDACPARHFAYVRLDRRNSHAERLRNFFVSLPATSSCKTSFSRGVKVGLALRRGLITDSWRAQQTWIVTFGKPKRARLSARTALTKSSLELSRRHAF
jgi:hypothetical protein